MIWPLPSLPLLLLLQAMSWTKLMFECKTFWGCPWAPHTVALLPRGLTGLAHPWLWRGCTAGTPQGPSLSPGRDLEPEPSQLSNGATARPCLCAKQAVVWSINVFCSHSSGTKLDVTPRERLSSCAAPEAPHIPWTIGKASVGCGKGLRVSGVTSGALPALGVGGESPQGTSCSVPAQFGLCHPPEGACSPGTGTFLSLGCAPCPSHGWECGTPATEPQIGLGWAWWDLKAPLVPPPPHHKHLPGCFKPCPAWLERLPGMGNPQFSGKPVPGSHPALL